VTNRAKLVFYLHVQTNHMLGMPRGTSFRILFYVRGGYYGFQSATFLFLDISEGVYSLARFSFKTCFLYILGMVVFVDFNRSLAVDSICAPSYLLLHFDVEIYF